MVHYKIVNGHPKRKRAEMAVGVIGYVYSPACSSLGQKQKSKPQNGYYKKRRQLKAKDWVAGTIWKTITGEITGSSATPEGYNVVQSLTW